MAHEAFHVVFLIAFFALVAGGFLGLIRPLIETGSGDPRLPGPRATALFFAGALLAGAADWILHRYVI